MSSTTKPEKPSPDFPLFAHASGKWAKKIDGKLRYFGRWDDPQGALAEYNKAIGKKTKSVNVGRSKLTLETAANLFLTSKKRAAEKGMIGHTTYREYQATCRRFADHLGRTLPVSALTPKHFEAFREHRLKSLNVVTIGNEVTRVRTMFHWLYESQLIKQVPNFGPEFRKSPARVLRRHRREQGKKLFTPKAVNLLLDEAGIHLRAMILLGINCGYGPTDCGRLPIHCVDLDRGWIDFARPKTEVDRLSPLWPETVAALRLSLERRLEPNEAAANRFFVQPSGQSWDVDRSSLPKYFTAVRRRLLFDGGMYWLRRTFATIGGETGDQVAVNYLMGHVDPSMAAVYRQEVKEERLTKVTNHVREWLQPPY